VFDLASHVDTPDRRASGADVVLDDLCDATAVLRAISL
jgi:hypothetical protein